MKLVRCQQGSEEWHRARAGKITGSNFHLTRASARLKTGPRKGGFGEKALNYAFRLAIERIAGAPLDEGHETWAMARGHELEPVARQEHEIAAGVLVDSCGFILTDDEVFGCSLDGLVDDDGAAEYKCFVAPERVRAIVVSGDWSEVMDQAQGGLWISGRKWIDTCLYCPALAPAGRALTWKRFYRDEDYIAELELDLIEFKALVDDYERVLREPSVQLPHVPPAPAPAKPRTAAAGLPESIF